MKLRIKPRSALLASVCLLWLLPSAIAGADPLKPLHVLSPPESVEKPRDAHNPTFHPGGKPVLLVVGQEAVLWNVETGKEVHRFEDPWTWGLSAHFSPDGSQILISAARGVDKGPATAYDAQTFEPRWQVEPEEWGFFWSCFSRGGTYAVVSRQYQRLLDPDTGKDLKRLELDMHKGQRGTFLFVRFSPDDSLMFSTTDKGINSIWDVAAEKEAHRLSHGGLIWDALFAPDGSYLATASEDRTAVLWDPATGKKRHTLTHEGSVYDLDISADGKTVLTCSGDQTAVLWDAATGKKTQTFQHDGEVLCAELSPDGKLVLTGTSKGLVHLWSSATGEEVATAKPHEAGVGQVRFSPDGRYFAVTGGKDAAVFQTPSAP